MSLKHVTLYTDGGCLGNPGPGGYGAILRFQDAEKIISGGFALTTNNRMELYAAIAGLSALKYPCRVTLYSDSRYVVDGISKGWARRWRANGWMRNRTDPAENPDLWERLLSLCEKHTVEFVWVKGHAGDPLNERCDVLTRSEASRPDLPRDTGYDARRPAG